MGRGHGIWNYTFRKVFLGIPFSLSCKTRQPGVTRSSSSRLCWSLGVTWARRLCLQQVGFRAIKEATAAPRPPWSYSLAVTLSSDLKDFLLEYLCSGFLESGSSYDPWHHVMPQIPHFQNGIKHGTSKGC